MRKIISMDLLILQLITLQTLFHATFCCAVRSGIQNLNQPLVFM